MTIKGTLETFNLRELLQMLAFNQKVGTLVLETESGTRTVHVDRGRASLVSGDRLGDLVLARVLRRRDYVATERLERPLQIAERSGRFLGDVLSEMGLLDEATRRMAWEEAFAEAFLDLALTAIHRFEFLEDRAVCSTRADGTPLEPAVAVEGLLLDLTRRLDQWALAVASVPTMREVYEGTGLAVDLGDVEDLDAALAERAIAKVDGVRTLEEVVHDSDVDRLTVVQLVAALVQAGGLRAVPVEDLVSRGVDFVGRGEARRALPLLRRAIERDQAPPDVRLHLADALESAGDPAAAAAELDTFAALNEGRAHLEVFDALDRALRLRGNDLSSAARLCDHYLSHRPWLRERREKACEALRTLLHAANVDGKPIEAAARLATFVENGEAPSEDLLVLADLYTAAGERLEAAGALYTRAKILIEEGRIPAARSLLQRALELDGSRSDARQQLREIESKEHRRRKKRRIALLLGLLVMLLLAGAASIHYYGREMDDQVRRLREPAEAAVDEAEKRTAALLAAFEARVAAARTAEAPDPGLADAAEQLKKDAKEYAAATEDEIHGLASALESFGPRQERSTNFDALEGLRRRSQGLVSRAQHAAKAVHEEAELSLLQGERDHTAGRFRAARAALLAARNLGIHDAAIVARAQQLLGRVDDYIRECAAGERRVKDLLATGDVERAFRAGVQVLKSQLDSDLTHELRFPVRLSSTPAGAEVWFGDLKTPYRTPCVLLYSPFDVRDLRVRLPGHTPWTTRLPEFADLTGDDPRWKGWRPILSASLPSGVRWVVRDPQLPLGALWDSAGTLVALARDGSRTVAIDPRTGRLGSGADLSGEFPSRRGGVVRGRFEWRILGTRTLHVLSAAGSSWDAQVPGTLERAPAEAEGVVAVVDESGTAHGFDVATGVERWRHALGSPPTQPLYASSLGFLAACADGSVWAIPPREGRPARLAATGPRRVALPLGDGAVLLGGGDQATRRLTRASTVQPLPDTAPLVGSPVWVGPQLVAWVEEGGVRVLRPTGEASSVPALGSPRALAEAAGVFYGLDASGTLTAVSADAPDRVLWQMSMGGPPEADLIVLGDALFTVVNAGVVAVER